MARTQGNSKRNRGEHPRDSHEEEKEISEISPEPEEKDDSIPSFPEDDAEAEDAGLDTEEIDPFGDKWEE